MSVETTGSSTKYLYGMSASELKQLNRNTLIFGVLTAVVVFTVLGTLMFQASKVNADTPEKDQPAAEAVVETPSVADTQAVVTEPTPWDGEAQDLSSGAPKAVVSSVPTDAKEFWTAMFFTVSSKRKDSAKSLLDSLPADMFGGHEKFLLPVSGGKNVVLCAGRFTDKNDPELQSLLSRIKAHKDFKSAYASKVKAQ